MHCTVVPPQAAAPPAATPAHQLLEARVRGVEQAELVFDAPRLALPRQHRGPREAVRPAALQSVGPQVRRQLRWRHAQLSFKQFGLRLV